MLNSYNLIIYKIITGSFKTGLFMVVATVVTTAILSQKSFASQSLYQYSVQLVAEQTNPWALPQTSEQFMESQQTPQFRGRSKAQPERSDVYRFYSGQMGRFVTPEYLESLKQQQMQMQMMPPMMPEGRQYNQRKYRRSPSTQVMPQQTWPRLPAQESGQGYNGSPTYDIGKDMGNVNPLYDVPAVSPWSSGSDLIYRGGSIPDSLPGDFSGSLPWVPNEALGGLPPIHTPHAYPFMGSEYDSERGIEDKVFNPFTFLPYGKP